jgi:hypothetical protein
LNPVLAEFPALRSDVDAVKHSGIDDRVSAVGSDVLGVVKSLNFVKVRLDDVDRRYDALQVSSEHVTEVKHVTEELREQLKILAAVCQDVPSLRAGQDTLSEQIIGIQECLGTGDGHLNASFRASADIAVSRAPKMIEGEPCNPDASVNVQENVSEGKVSEGFSVARPTKPALTDGDGDGAVSGAVDRSMRVQLDEKRVKHRDDFLKYID